MLGQHDQHFHPSRFELDLLSVAHDDQTAGNDQKVADPELRTIREVIHAPPADARKKTLSCQRNAGDASSCSKSSGRWQ